MKKCTKPAAMATGTELSGNIEPSGEFVFLSVGYFSANRW